MHTRRCIIILLQIFKRHSKGEYESLKTTDDWKTLDCLQWNESTRVEHYKMLNDHHHFIHKRWTVLYREYVSVGLYTFHMTHHLTLGFDFIFIFKPCEHSLVLFILCIILLLLNYYNIRGIGCWVHCDFCLNGKSLWTATMAIVVLILNSFFCLNARFHNKIKWFDDAKCNVK